MKSAKSPLLGAHMSIAGGLERAIERGESVDCTTLQIFTKNNNRWQGKALTDKQVEIFKQAREESKIGPIFAHNCYLINLASPEEEAHAKSMAAMLDELERAERLGLEFLVIHPGSHLGKGEEWGIKRIAESLSRLHEQTAGYKVMILLEITAGQGNHLGYRFEQLAEIIALTKQSERLGVCFDTCHAFAAGYDIRTAATYRKTMKAFDETIGLDRLKVFHLNDSKKPLDSRRDRHEHIGQGELGLEPFRLIMNDRRFQKTPKVIETHKETDLEEDRMNLGTLRGLVGLKAGEPKKKPSRRKTK